MISSTPTTEPSVAPTAGETRLRAVEEGLRSLAATVAGLERRLAAMEDGATPVVAAGAPATDAAAVAPSPADTGVAAESADWDVAAVLPLAGRTLLVLGGAYLLRALTREAAPEIGAFLGLVWALAWLLPADRDAARGRPRSSLFHGLATLAVALPLFWETTVHLGMLSPSAGAVLLAGLAGAVLAVAARRRLQALAALGLVAPTAAALAAAVATRHVVAFAAVLVALSAAGAWLATRRRWPLMPWTPAVAADLVVLAAGFGATLERGAVGPAAAVALQLALVGAGLGVVVAELRGGRRGASVFEIVQAVLALAVGYGGLVVVLDGHPWGAPLAGAASLAAAAYVYRLGFRLAADGRKREYLLLSSAALAFVAGGGALLPLPASLPWAVAAPLAAWAGSRTRHFTLALHASALATLAAISSGSLAAAGRALVAPAGAAWPPFPPLLPLVLAAAGAAVVFPPRGDERFWGGWLAVPRTVLLALLGWGLAGLVLLPLVPRLAGDAGGLDPGRLATARTVVVAVAALAFAAVGRRLVEAVWLVHPVLFAGAAKLVFEDFRAGRPETLFVSLAVYGTALILAPRLRRAVPPPTA